MASLDADQRKREEIAEALAEAAFTGQLPALEDESTGAVDRARLLTDFVLDRWESHAAFDETQAKRSPDA